MSDIVADIRARHREDREIRLAACVECEQDWPCDAARAADEIERMHSWDGLMRLLDEHWPADIFPTLAGTDGRDPGPRIVSLLRWVGALAARLDAVRAECDGHSAVGNYVPIYRVRAALDGIDD